MVCFTYGQLRPDHTERIMSLVLLACIVVGSAIGMGYVNLPNLTAKKTCTSSFEIEVACKRFAADASLQGFYDPSGARMRS